MRRGWWYAYTNPKLHAEHVHNNVDGRSRGSAEQQHRFRFGYRCHTLRSSHDFDYGERHLYRFGRERNRSTHPCSGNAWSNRTTHHSVDEFPCEYLGNLHKYFSDYSGADSDAARWTRLHQYP